MVSDDNTAQNQHDSIRTLGICWLVYGIIRIVAAIWLVSFTNTATLMFGALLNRVPNPFSMMSFFHFVYACIVVFSVVCGVFGILAGWSLLAGQRSARILALVAAFLSLSDIPLGVTLGIYSLITLLPMRATHAPTVTWHDRTADLRSHSSAT